MSYNLFLFYFTLQLVLKKLNIILIMLFILSVLMLQRTVTPVILYDEDINLVFPAGELSHSPDDIPADRYLGSFNNCTCHESPDVLVVCFGAKCQNFPLLSISVPLFKLKLSSIVTIRHGDFRHLNNIEALEIEGNNMLTTIESGCFKKMSRLRNLTISNNILLHYLDENIFEGLRNLETLCMSKNGFKRVVDVARALSPKYVPRLELLDLSQNVFHSIKEDDFHYMNGTELEQLNMHLCGIINIHPNSLEPLRKLTVLRLGQNLFNRTTITNLIVRVLDSGIPLDLLNLLASGLRRSLPLELLEAVGRSNISDIILAQNHFDQIDDDSFPDMPNLATMDLRECYISSISNEAFRKLTNLSSILINRNRLTTIPIAVLIPSLIILDIAGNSENEQTYFFVPDNIFINMTILDNLQLSYNNIQYITNMTLVGLSSLRILNLKNTQLSYIEDGAFTHTPNLLHLNLIKNPLLTIMPMTSETFRGLDAVHVMLLGFCGIKNLTASPGLFQYARNITYLGLDNNEIQIIAPNQLTHLHYLQKVHLENNKLTPWNKEILPKMEFKELAASQNKFTYMTTAMLEDLKSVQSLNLEGNPFRCDCSLYPVVQWLRYNKMAVIYTQQSNFVASCDTPETWRKTSIVAYFNFLSVNPGDCEVICTYTQLLFTLIFIILLFLIMLMLYLFRWHIRYWIFLSKLSFMRHNFWAIHKKPDERFEYEFDAFISYSVEDRVWVSQLCEVLEPDLKLCVFERDFPPGAPISHAVLHAVAASRRTLLVVSEAFAKSHWCRWETQLAQYHQIFFRQDSVNGPDDTLLLIRLQPVKKHATPTLKYLINTRIYLDWPQEPEKQIEFWNKLKITLAAPKGEAKKKLKV